MNVFEIKTSNENDIALFKAILTKGSIINGSKGISCSIIGKEGVDCKFISSDNEYNMIVKFLDGSYTNQSFKICKARILYADDYEKIKLVLFVKNNDNILLLHIMADLLDMSKIYRLLCNS